MKKLALSFFSCLYAFILIAQTDTTIYNNVILIKDEHVCQQGNSYLIDIPLFNRNSNRNFYNASRIPSQLFLQQNKAVPFLNRNSFTFIVSDTAYYRSLRQSAKANRHVKGVPAYIIYNAQKHLTVTYGFNQPKIYFVYDSIIAHGFTTRLNLKTTVDTTSDSLLIYYYESHMPVHFGNHAPIYAKSLDDFITYFEKWNHVKIKNTYVLYNGTNIAATYFTLDGLTPQQKLSFILQRRFYGLVNMDAKLFEAPPGIYMPYYVDKQQLKLLH